MKNLSVLPEYVFLKEWKPFDVINKKVERAILSHFIKHSYTWQPDNNENSKRNFKPVSFSQINKTLGLAYTSSGDFAGKWCCNGGYLFADNTHYFCGFVVTDKGQIIGIADDKVENSIYINIGTI